MEYLLLTLLVVVSAGNLALLLVFARKLSSVTADIRAFIHAPDEKTPSPLANTVQIVADMIGRSICNLLKTTFMGKQSGESKSTAMLAGDIALDTLGSSPLGAILSSFPALGKTLRKHPELIDAAMGMLSKKAGSNGSASDSGSNAQAVFRL